MNQKPDRHSETSEAITERARKPYEGKLLGNNPAGSVLRILGLFLLVVLVLGTLFYLVQS